MLPFFKIFNSNIQNELWTEEKRNRATSHQGQDVLVGYKRKTDLKSYHCTYYLFNF
jgi:hypothetical protein